MKKATLCIFLFFSVSSLAIAQENPYSLLLVEKTAVGPTSKNASISYKYSMVHYEEGKSTSLLTQSSNINMNDIVQVFNDLKKQGWKIVSSTENFYREPHKVSVDQMSEQNIMEISTQEYLLSKE